MPFGPGDVTGLTDALPHILQGEEDGSGGHLFEVVAARMIEGKIAFPASWTGEDIERACLAVIGGASAVRARGGRFLLLEQVGQVLVGVQVIKRKAAARVRTAHPVAGVNVMRVHNGKLVEVKSHP